MSEMNTRPAPFDGAEWEGWTKRQNHNAVERGTEGTPSFTWISVIGQLYLEDGESSCLCLWFPTPEAARQVAGCIESAKAGKQVGPVSQWQPIESAPKDGTVIVCGPAWDNAESHGQFVTIANRHRDTWFSPEIAIFKDGNWEEEGCSIRQPTHWMPLPEPPKEVTE